MPTTSDQSPTPDPAAGPAATRPGPSRQVPPPTWRQALRIATHDLGRRVRDRSLVIQGVVAPIALGLIVGLAFGGGLGGSITIGIADADGSPYSGGLAASLLDDEPAGDEPPNDEPADDEPGGDESAGAEPAGDEPELALRFEAVDPATVRDAVADGTVQAAVVLPPGFEEAAQTGAPVTIEVVGHPGRVLSTSVAESVAEGLAGQLAATQLAVATTGALADSADGALDPQEVARDARELGSPLRAAPRDVQDDYSIIGYFAPAMAMLFLFFTVGAAARSVVTERNEGTLPRVRAAPVTTGAILAGKTLSVVVLGLLSLGTVWAVTALGFGVDWGDPAGVAAVLVAVVLAIAGITVLITGLARTANQADALTTIVALVLAVLGGSFFFGGGGLVAVSKQLTPNGQAINALTELAAGEAALVDVTPTVLLLLAFGAVTGAIGLVTLRRKVSQ